MPPEPSRADPRAGAGAGFAFAVGAYGSWGVLPLFFIALSPTGAIEIVSWRIVLSLAFCFLLITLTRQWASFGRLLRDRRIMATMALAAALILANWLVYVFATLSGHVVEASLGYFINPIVTVLLGVLVLREKLRPLQWVAIGVSTVAVLVLAVNYGAFPWIALTLAFSFGFYGLIKKRVGGRVDAVGGLTLETAWLTPLAIAALVVLGVTTQLTLGTVSAWHTVLLLSAGVVTATPLLFFAAAARRLPLTVLGLTQYLAPVLQFLIGVLVIREQMPPARWVGFALVWVALVILTVDMVRSGRGPRRAFLERG